mmetsp:Transcript_54288/g.151071  ORF Transcript_54288/g.151071 Transcript_54288/m.151071 type:complete len:361 (+) Transcript_54288:242-1324(+)
MVWVGGAAYIGQGLLPSLGWRVIDNRPGVEEPRTACGLGRGVRPKDHGALGRGGPLRVENLAVVAIYEDAELLPHLLTQGQRETVASIALAFHRFRGPIVPRAGDRVPLPWPRRSLEASAASWPKRDFWPGVPLRRRRWGPQVVVPAAIAKEMDIRAAEAAGAHTAECALHAVLQGLATDQDRVVLAFELWIQLPQMQVARLEAPSDAVQHLHERRDTSNFDAIANKALCAGDQQGFPELAVAQSMPARAYLHRVAEESSNAMCFHCVNVQRRDACLAASVDKNLLLGWAVRRSQAGTPSAVVVRAARDKPHGGIVATDKPTISLPLESSHNGSRASFASNVSVRRGVEREAPATRTKET